MLNVQADLRRRLATALEPVQVRVSVPGERPRELVTVRREGGGQVSELQDGPGVGIFCWAETEARAYAIAERVAAAISELAFADGYEVKRMEAMYSTPDPDTNGPRWYLSYTFTTHDPR